MPSGLFAACLSNRGRGSAEPLLPRYFNCSIHLPLWTFALLAPLDPLPHLDPLAWPQAFQTPGFLARQRAEAGLLDEGDEMPAIEVGGLKGQGQNWAEEGARRRPGWLAMPAGRAAWCAGHHKAWCGWAYPPSCCREGEQQGGGSLQSSRSRQSAPEVAGLKRAGRAARAS